MIRVLAKTRAGLLGLSGVFAITILCHRVFHANTTVAAVTLLLYVLITGVNVNLQAAVIASISATLCLDYFFIPPIGSITIADPQGWILLTVFLAVALITTNLSTRLRRQRDELFFQQTEAEKLYALSRSMLHSDGTEALERLVVNKCMELFSFREMILFELQNGVFYRSQSESSILDEMLQHAARCGSVYQSEADGLTITPIALGNKVFGSLAFRGTAPGGQRLQSLSSTIAMGIAQMQLREAGSRAEAVRKSEELKSVMIDALAHDLKTPLTAIEAASDMLLAPVSISPVQRHDLLEVIQQETNGVRRIVDEAIHLARIDAEKLKLDSQPVSVDDLIDAAISSLGERAAVHDIERDLAGTDTGRILVVSVDRDLVIQALKQLLDNAMKYSPANSTIRVSATGADGVVVISVRDHGQGLTELEQGRVFDKFYRGHEYRSTVQGTGMGLAIVKEILEAHGGSAGVRSEPGEGAEFFITLRAVPQEALLADQGV